MRSGTTTGSTRSLSLVRSVALAAALLGSGCAAITNPVADGIPVRRLPPEALGVSVEAARPVSLAALTPPDPGQYRLAPGDILGIWIEGVLGERGGAPPVRIPEQPGVPPGLGFPIPIGEKGTIPLPLIAPLDVNGLTVEEAQAKIIRAYTVPEKLLKEGAERVIVTLLRPRSTRVLVLREDAGATTFGTTGGFNSLGGGGGTSVSVTRKAAGFPLDLPVPENTLLNALTRSGGLPGAEAEDEILIERGAKPGAGGQPRQTIRVPLRLLPGQPFNVRPEDLFLEPGDTVLVRARSGALFYTGGLLPSRAFPLPRDRDVDILEAVAIVGGPILNGGINANNLSGQIVQTGLGFPSPSQVTILRRLRSGSQIPILVDLNRAVKDPRERLLVQAGDVVILQQTPGEAFAQYMTTNLRFNFSAFFRRPDASGSATITAP